MENRTAGKLLPVLKSSFKADSVSYAKFSEIGKYDCLIISDDVKLSGVQQKKLLSFLKSGRDLVLLGANDINLPELPVFERRDIYCYKDAKVIKTYEQQDVLKSKIEIKGSFDGLSAIAFEYPEVSRYVPVLAVEDEYSRNVAFACGVLVNYAGEFKNSNWILFGVDYPEFYKSKDFFNVLIKLLNTVKSKYLAEGLKKQDAADKKKNLPITSPAPKDYVKLSEDGKHFILPNGKKFFALGCNYLGPFERQTEFGEDYYNLKRIEQDFQKAKEAGINSFRFWNVRIDQYPERFKTIIELARKYQIYLILQPREHPLPTDKAMINVFKRTAEVAGGETIVLGYDLMNEPYITMIGSVRANGRPSEILQQKVYERYSDKYYDKKWVEYAYSNPGWPEIGKWIKGTDAKNLYAAYSMGKQYIEKFNQSSDYSCLYGINGQLSIEPEYKDFIGAVDSTFAYWISSHQQAMRQLDKNHFYTVGYNTSLAALPCNKMLDFTSHHIYQMPYSYEDVKKAVTTFDRLRALWPNKPITMGEFGFSSGLKMPDGKYLGQNASSVGEMMVYLYAFAHDYSGAYLWLLSEWPVTNMKYNAPWISSERQIYESQFGMYYYDGTELGRPKPIAYATKFFREYIDSHEPGSGKLDIIRADTPMQTGYVFTDKNALFVGNTKYDSSPLKFYSEEPTNVMLVWDANKLKIMATNDTEVIVDMTQFGFAKNTEFDLTGNYDSLLKVKDAIQLKLLEGQPVTFCIKGKK
ncbi:MAG: glycoside hydrolase family 5 protein [Planctomycetaceae bacterium]|nr:glycoside hydrolase family 5 protein [Planctomycetaceae bacterium]